MIKLLRHHCSARLLWSLLASAMPLATLADSQPNSPESCWTSGSMQVSAAASYADCLANVAPGCAGNQVNDQCFLQKGTNSTNGNITSINTSAGLFINITNPQDSAKTIYIDDTHNEFHVRTGRFLPFSVLLGVDDNYQVKDFSSVVKSTINPTFDTNNPTLAFTYTPANGNIPASGTLAQLKAGDVLVISNPLNTANNQQIPQCNAKDPYPAAPATPQGYAKSSTNHEWVAPIYNAFTSAEMDAVVAWVKAGGALLLIADHFPFPGAAADLAQKFGFSIADGYGFDPDYNDLTLYDVTHDILPNPVPGINTYNAAEKIMGQQMTTATPAPAGGYMPDPNNPVVINGQTYCGVKPRTVKDDLKQYISMLLVQLGGEVNSMVFWAGQPATPGLAPVASAQPDNGIVNTTSGHGFADGDGWLVDHPVVRGMANTNTAIPFLTTFTGTSFTYTPSTADQSLINQVTESDVLRLGYGTFNVLTLADDAYVGATSDDSTTNMITSILSTQKIPAYTAQWIKTEPLLVTTNAQGGAVTPYTQYTLQGATAKVGAGRLALWGEAGMWSAQMTADGKTQMGFNNSMAASNQQFIVNMMHWLDGSLNGDPGATPTAGTQSANTPSNTGFTGAVLTNVTNDMKTEALSKTYQKDLLNNTINGVQSYGAAYQQANSGKPGSIGSPGSFGGGGCSISRSGGDFDPTLPMLVLAAMGYPLLRRRGRRT